MNVGAQAPDAQSLDSLEANVQSLRGGPPDAFGLALSELAQGYAYSARHREAVRMGREAAEVLRAVGDSAELAQAHNQVGLSYWNLVQYDSAVVQLSRAQELWLGLDDRDALGRVANNLGATHYQWGNYEAALAAFLRAVEYRRESGNERGQSLALANVGRTYQDWGQRDRAREAYEESIRMADRVGYAFAQAYARLNLGELYLELEDWDRAEDLFGESLSYYESEASDIVFSDVLGGRVLNHLGMATLRMERGDPEGAIQDLHDLLELAGGVENPRYLARVLLDLGRAYSAAGRHDEALEHLLAGLDMAQARDQRPIALDFLATLSLVEELRGVPGQALVHLQAHLALRDSIFNQAAVQRIAAMEAQTEAERQELENALLRGEQRAQQAVIARQRVATLLGAGLLGVSLLFLGVLVFFNRRGRERELALADSNRSLELANEQLRAAQSELHTLKGLIPICSSCKRVRDDEGYWETVETYISERSSALFSHSICAECGPRLYGSDWSAQVGVGEEGVQKADEAFE
jgi:tetratricopeptide (TPR) repeat protein